MNFFNKRISLQRWILDSPLRVFRGDHALGFIQKNCTHIGWQCLANNAGSRAVASKVGFQLDCEYIALSSSLPTENPGDLSSAECEDWALHYESAPPGDARSCYRAAATRALAGQAGRALVHLRRLLTLPWQGDPAWFEEDFRFDSLRELPEFQQLLEKIKTKFGSES